MEQKNNSEAEFLEAAGKAFREIMRFSVMGVMWEKFARVIKDDKKELLLDEFGKAFTGLAGKIARKTLRCAKAQEKINDRQRRRRESTERTIKEAQKYNQDLVEIPDDGTPCEICAEIQGKVYSITGKTPGYPVLTEDKKPPLCDDCRHYLRVVSEEILARRRL